MVRGLKKRPVNIAVIGGHKCSKKNYALARELGRLIARRGWILLCGGGPGIMEAACRGAKEAGGITVGILPGSKGKEANEFLDVRLPTGIGYMRNVLIVRAADVIIALDGEYGTLSEIAFAFNDITPVIGIDTWDVKGVVKADTPLQAIKKAEILVKKIFQAGKEACL